MKQWRMVLSIFWVLLGAVLLGLGMAEIIDSFWSGMGGGFIAVSILRHSCLGYFPNEIPRQSFGKGKAELFNVSFVYVARFG